MRSPWLDKLSLVFGPRPPLSWVLSCLINIIALISVLSSSLSNSFDPLTSPQAPNIYTNHRRLKEQAAVDYLELRSLSQGANRQKERSLCSKERENFVPRYNVLANLLSGYKDGVVIGLYIYKTPPESIELGGRRNVYDADHYRLKYHKRNFIMSRIQDSKDIIFQAARKHLRS